MTVRYLPVFPENPGNPARCHVPTGRIDINRQVWDVLTPEQQQFVLQHELGHYRLQTYDEVEADGYALSRLALRKPNSLWDYVTSVRAISHDNPRRVEAAQRGALRVAARDGSAKAAELLRQLGWAAADGSTERPRKAALAVAALAMAAAACYLIINKRK